MVVEEKGPIKAATLAMRGEQYEEDDGWLNGGS
jgi:hypothetical protein